MLKVEILLRLIGILIEKQTFGKMACQADVNGPFLPLHAEMLDKTFKKCF